MSYDNRMYGMCLYKNSDNRIGRWHICHDKVDRRKIHKNLFICFFFSHFDQTDLVSDTSLMSLVMSRTTAPSNVPFDLPFIHIFYLLFYSFVCIVNFPFSLKIFLTRHCAIKPGFYLLFSFYFFYYLSPSLSASSMDVFFHLFFSR